jgi:hypothetical protein
MKPLKHDAPPVPPKTGERLRPRCGFRTATLLSFMGK